MGKIDVILPLQEIDAQIADIRKRLEREPKLLAEKERNLESVKKDFESVKAEIMKLNVEKKDHEIQIQTINDAITKFKNNILSSKKIKNEEYQEILKQISQKEVERGTHDERIIEIMYTVEDKEKEKARKDETVHAAQKEFDETKKNIEKERSELQAELDSLNARRADAKTNVVSSDSDLYKIYERILRNKTDGVAIVPTRVSVEFSENATDEDSDEGIDISIATVTCTGCNCQLTPDQVRELLDDSRLVQCKECGRIVYMLKSRPQKTT